MRGHEDEWMELDKVFVPALGVWLTPGEYIAYIEALRAQHVEEGT